jgi:zinc protease
MKNSFSVKGIFQLAIQHLMKKMTNKYLLCVSSVVFAACASTTNVPSPALHSAAQKSESADLILPVSYRNIKYPDFQYVAPYPKDSRVVLSDSITGYIIADRTLPLIHFTVLFRESTVPGKPGDRAALDLLSSMFRRGGAAGIPAKVLDDSLEFISADISGRLSTFRSSFSIDCLSKNFVEMLPLAKEVFLSPAFENEPLEIQKKAFINAYEHRYDTPGNILNALENYVNYLPHPRLWNANSQEYKAVSQNMLTSFAQGKFAPDRIIFAISGDFNKDSMLVILKDYFAKWKTQKEIHQPPSAPLEFKAKPGIYLVDKAIFTSEYFHEPAICEAPSSRLLPHRSSELHLRWR